MKEALKLGVIYVVISTVISLISTAISDDFTFTTTSVILGLIYPLVILVIGGRYLFRRIPDIDLSYGVAVKYLVISGTIGMLGGMIFSIVMYADNQDMRKAWSETQIAIAEKTVRMTASMTGANETEVEEGIDRLHQSIESGEVDLEEAYPFQMSKLPTSIGSSLIMSLIYALIAAIFVRVKQPT